MLLNNVVVLAPEKEIVVVGGTLNQTQAATDVWSSPDGSFWSLRTPDAGFPARLGGCTFADDSRVVLAGGVQYVDHDPSSPLYLNDVWVSQDATLATWGLRATNTSWSGREGAGCVSFLGDWFVLGGMNAATGALNDMYVSSDDGLTWESSGDVQATWSPRAYFGVTTFLGRLFLAGGVNFDPSGGAPSYYNDVYSTADGFSWVRVTSLSPWSGRSHACFFAFNDVLWLVGGQQSQQPSSTQSSQVWRSGTNGRYWESVDSGPAPFGPRDSFGCAVVAPVATSPGGGSPSNPAASTLFILGGRGLRSGTRFLPLNDVWSSTRNLLCEDNSLVCSARGTCTPPTTTTTSSNAIASVERVGYGALVPPLPYNCSCDAGFVGMRCEQGVCTAQSCIHGSCVSVNSTKSSSSSLLTYNGVVVTGGAVCQCTDPSKWTGFNCDQAICMPGCSPTHGSCRDNPGTCVCDGDYIGALCDIELTIVRIIGRYIESHVAQIYVSVTVAGIAVTAVVSLLANAMASHSLSSAASSSSSASGHGGGHGSGDDRDGEDETASASGFYSFVPGKGKLTFSTPKGPESRPLLGSNSNSSNSFNTGSIDKKPAGSYYGAGIGIAGVSRGSLPVDIAIRQATLYQGAQGGADTAANMPPEFSLPRMGQSSSAIPIPNSASKGADGGSSSFHQAAAAIAGAATLDMGPPTPTVIIGGAVAGTPTVSIGGIGGSFRHSQQLAGTPLTAGAGAMPVPGPKRVRFSHAETND